MTDVACAMIVTDAKKAAVEAHSETLTPDFTLGFIRRVCPADPAPTPETPATHWYCNIQSVSNETVQVWQDAADKAGPADAFFGLIIFTAVNSTDALGWAQTNLGSEGLMFVPDPE